MAKYTVYFEIYGKFMKATVEAETEAKAQDAVRNRIVFHKFEKHKPKPTSGDSIILDFFNGFRKLP